MNLLVCVYSTQTSCTQSSAHTLHHHAEGSFTVGDSASMQTAAMCAGKGQKAGGKTYH